MLMEISKMWEIMPIYLFFALCLCISFWIPNIRKKGNEFIFSKIPKNLNLILTVHAANSVSVHVYYVSQCNVGSY